MNSKTSVKSFERVAVHSAHYLTSGGGDVARKGIKALGNHGLVLADAGIADVEVLLGRLEPGTDLWRVDSDGDFRGMLSDALSRGYETLHFLGHGQPGAITFAGRAFAVEDFTALSSGLFSGKRALHFWSCMTGSGARGRAFVDGISQAFGAVVTAFSGLVGSGSKGGSWVPDVMSHTNADTRAPFLNLASYRFTLPAVDVFSLTTVATANGLVVEIRATAAGATVNNIKINFQYEAALATLVPVSSQWDSSFASPDISLLQAQFSSVSNETSPGLIEIGAVSVGTVDLSAGQLLYTLTFACAEGTNGFAGALVSGTYLKFDNTPLLLGTLPALNIADTTIPVVTLFSPLYGGSSASVGNNISLTFSEAIQLGYGVLSIHKGSPDGVVVEHYDPSAPGSNLSVAGKVLTIDPTAVLEFGTHYFVTFADGAVKDLAGNNYAGTLTYDFTTAFQPVLASFDAPVGSARENTPAEVTFADLVARGDEADVDGTVTAFVVKEVSSGTLLIGADASSATVYEATTNNTIDATHHAFWTPAQNASGPLNAFTVVALDKSGIESATPVQTTVSVQAVKYSADAWQNIFDGTAYADTIYADALDLAHGATTTRDVIYGNDGNDSIIAGAGDDAIAGGAGDDSIDGGTGVDSVLYNGYKQDYIITNHGGGLFTVEDINLGNGDDGTDTLVNVEQLYFWDVAIRELVVSFIPASGGGDWAQNSINGTLSDDTIDADALAVLYVSTLTTYRDWIDGGAGNDTIYGGKGGDNIRGGTGDDMINGGPDNKFSRLLTESYHDSWTQDNRVYYDGKYSEFTLTRLAEGTFEVKDNRVVDGDEGTDILTNIDVLQFGDWVYVALAPSYSLVWEWGYVGEQWSALKVLYAYGDGTEYADVIGLSSALEGVPLLYQFAGNDILRGGGGDDTLYGGAGDDRLEGRAGDDVLYGGSGDDWLDGGEGKDAFHGGTGMDTVRFDGNFSGYTITENSGSLAVNKGGVSELLYDIERIAFDDKWFTLVSNFYGTQSRDSGARNDIIGTLLGDRLDADAMALSSSSAPVTYRDWIDGDAGNDSIAAGQGGDQIRGGAGNDTIDGGEVTLPLRLLTANSFYGTYSVQNQAYYSGASKKYSITEVIAGANDLFSLAAGQRYFIVEDTRSGSPDGKDILYNIDALQFSDKEVRLSAAVWLYTTLQDTPVVPAGTPINGEVTLTAADFAPDQQLAQVTFYKNQMSGVLKLNGQSLLLVDAQVTVNAADIAAGKLTFTPTGSDGLRGSVEVYNIVMEGTAYADTLGYAPNESVPLGSYDFSGSDRLTGGAGNDRLYGGAGADTFRGDAGNDTIVGGTDRSVLSKAPWDQNGSNGYDVAEFSGNYSRYTLTFKSASGALVTSFDQAATVIVSDSKSDSKGGDGTDTLSGVEVLRFADGEKNLAVLKHEYFNYDWNTGQKVITSYRYDGSDFDDTITSTSALYDEVHAKAGNDSISTGAGGDWIDGGEGNDTIDGGANGTRDQWGNIPVDVAQYDAPMRRFNLAKNSDGTIQVTDRLGAEFGGLGSDKLINIETLRFNDGDVSVAVRFFPYSQGRNQIYGTQFNDLVDADSFAVAQGDNHNDQIETKEGDDAAYGGLGADGFMDGAGNDFYDGGTNGTTQNSWENADVVGFTGVQKRYSIDVIQYKDLDVSLREKLPVTYFDTEPIVRVTDKVPAVNGGDGVNYLVNIERIQFQDASLDIWVTFSTPATLDDWSRNYILGGILDDTVHADLLITNSLTHRDYIDGRVGNDTLFGGAGGDELRGGLGDDLLDGGANGPPDVNGNFDTWQALDCATFSNSINRYKIQFFREALPAETGSRYNAMGVAALDGAFVTSEYFTETGIIVVQDLYDAAHGGEGRDVLRNIEVLQFSDCWEQLKLRYQHSTYDQSGYVLDNSTGNWNWQITGQVNRLEGFGSRFGDVMQGEVNAQNNLYGNGGNDILVGGNLRDELHGGAGDDTLDGGGNPAPTYPWDTSGYDVAYFDADRSEFEVIENLDGSFTVKHLIPANLGGQGTDIVRNVEYLQFRDSYEELVVIATPQSYWDNASSAWVTYSNYRGTNFNDSVADTVAGGINDFQMRNGNDTIIAGTGNDHVTAGGGHDLVYLDATDSNAPGGGDDQANLGTGNDTVYGGTGYDTVSYDDAVQRYIITVHARSGQPIFGGTTLGGELLATFSLSAAAVNGIYSSTLNFTKSSLGNSYDALTMYVQVADTLADQYGGEGVDQLFGIEQVTFEGGVLSFESSLHNGVTMQTGDFVNMESTVGTGGINGTSLADTVQGSDSNDWLQGWVGNDLLKGGSGDDTLNGGLGHDTLVGGADNTSDRNSYWNAGDTAQYAGAVRQRMHISEKLTDDAGGLMTGTAGSAYYIVTDLASLIDKTETAGQFDFSASNVNANVGYGQDILVGIERIQIGDTMLQLAPIIAEYTWSSSWRDDSTNTTHSYEVVRTYITGTFQNDLLTGTTHGDEIDGKAGNDTIDGGNETVTVGNSWEIQDVVRYAGARERYTIKGVLVDISGLTYTIIDPAHATATSVFGIQISDVLPDSSGGTGTDLLVNIERVEFNGSQLSIKPEINEYQDTWSQPGVTLSYVNIQGTEFDDVLNGKDGNDGIRGHAGNDTLLGGIGGDNLEGGAGNDVLVGGSNGVLAWQTDTAYYNASIDRFTVEPIYIDSSYTVVSQGNGATAAYRLTDILPLSDPASLGTDILVGIENLSFSDRWVSLVVNRWSWSDEQGNSYPNAEGTVFNDIISEDGSNSRDYMNGREGNDILLGGGNGDLLRGGFGNDLLDGGANGTTGHGWQDQDVAEFSGQRGRYSWSLLTTTGDATTGNVTLNGSDVASVAGGVLNLSASLSSDAAVVLTLAFSTANLFGKGAGFLVVDSLSADLGGDGTDLVFNVERFRFNDAEVELGIRADAWDWTGGGAHGEEPDGKPDSVSVIGTSGADHVTLTDIATRTIKPGVALETQIGYLEKIRLDVDLKEGDDTYIGGKGGESIRPGAGNDYIDAGLNEGTDQWGASMRDEVRFEGKAGRYILEDITVTRSGDNWSVASDRDSIALTSNSILASANAALFNLDLAGMQQGVMAMIAHAGAATTVSGWLVIDKLPADIEGTGVDAVVGAEVLAFNDCWMQLAVDTYYVRDAADRNTIVAASVRGTDSADAIKGNAIYDFSGGDWIEGNGGDDRILAGAGGDYIRGGTGDDTIDGGANGTPDQWGYTPKDTALYVGTFDRYVISGGTDASGRGYVAVSDLQLDGGDGTDTLYNIENLSFSDRWVRLSTESYAWRDGQTNKITGVSINGSMLADRIDGSLDEYVGLPHHIQGMEGNDTLVGGSGPDIFWGGMGDDEIIGGDNGVDQFGNPGNDVVLYDGMFDRYTVTLLTQGTKISIEGHEYTAGVDGVIVQVSDSMSIEDGGSGSDTLVGIEAIGFWDRWMPLQVTTIFTDFNGDGKADESYQRGTDGADLLVGDKINDRLDGGGGNDTINAGAGGDVITGGAGDDKIDGGANGTDAWGNELVDVAIYSGNFSNYSVNSQGGVVTVADNRIGNNNVSGTDTLVHVEALQFGDRFISLQSTRELKDFNYDGVTDQIVLRGTDLLGDTLLVATGDNLVSHLFEGLAGDDSLAGADGNDLFEGGSGNDTITGGDGIDKAIFSGNTADYAIIMPLANGADFSVTHKNGGTDGVDTLRGVEELIFADKVLKVIAVGEIASVTSILLDTDGDKRYEQTIWSGTDNADTITGTLDMTNIIDAGSGNDRLAGANLADTFTPGAGNDTIDGGTNEGVDANGQQLMDVVQFSGKKADFTIHTIQKSSFSLTGVVEAGDIYSVEVGSQVVRYTALSGESLSMVAIGLAAAIQSAVDTPSTLFTATTDGVGLTLAGEDMIYAVTPSVINGIRPATDVTGTLVTNITVSGANQSGASLVVNSVTGLSVGDSLVYSVTQNAVEVNYGAYIITSIDAGTKTLGLNSSMGASPANGTTIKVMEDNPDTTGAVTAALYDRSVAVSSGSETDILRNIETLLFDDQSLQLIASQTAKAVMTSSGLQMTYYVKGTDLADLIHGSSANEVFTGGTGRDHIVLGDSSGVDQARGFVAGSAGDVLTILLGANDSDGLNGTGIDTITEIMARAAQQGSDTLVDLGAGNSILLVGVSNSNLNLANFEIVHAENF